MAEIICEWPLTLKSSQGVEVVKRAKDYLRWRPKLEDTICTQLFKPLVKQTNISTDPDKLSHVHPLQYSTVSFTTKSIRESVVRDYV